MGLTVPFRFATNPKTDGPNENPSSERRQQKGSGRKQGRRRASIDGEAIDRHQKINQDRDTWALHHLTCLVTRPGDREESYFNIAGSKQLRREWVETHLKSDAIVLTATRLPLNDIIPTRTPGAKSCPSIDLNLDPTTAEKKKKTDARKIVKGSGEYLEERIFEAARVFLEWCSRRHIFLTERGEAVLAPERRDPAQGDRAFIRFRVADDEALFEWFGTLASTATNRTPETIETGVRAAAMRIRATAAYIIYTKELWAGGPSCLSIWGMSGPITFGFGAAIREMLGPNILERLQLRQSELIYVEIRSRSGGPLVPLDPDDHSPCWREWSFEWHRSGRIADLPVECPMTVTFPPLSYG